MRIYLDTSFIVPMFIKEATSAAVVTKLQAVSTEELTISLWTKAEFSSVLARRVRMQEMTAPLALETMNQFELMVSQSCQVLVPTAADFELTCQFIQQFQTQLRAGDALHLAIAKNHGASSIYTLDAGLARAAELLKIPYSLGV